MPKYPLLSAFIGIMQIFDAALLLKHHGGMSAVSMALAGVELIWAIVSLVVIFRVRDLKVRLLAAVFVAYNVAGLLYGMLWLPQSGDALIVPTAVMLAGGIFGLLFAISSAMLAFRVRPAA